MTEAVTLPEAWDDALALLENEDPAFLDVLRDYASSPRDANLLGNKVSALIMLGVCASAANLDEQGVRHYAREAVRHGATRAELVQVIEIVSILGIHSVTAGVPALLEECDHAGILDQVGPAQPDERAERLKAAFIEARSSWHDMWYNVIRLSPRLFKSYTSFSGAPWRTGILSPKAMEFIYIAIDFSISHLMVRGGQAHIRFAMEQGATADEIMEVLALVSTQGLHSVTRFLPIVLAELDPEPIRPS